MLDVVGRGMSMEEDEIAKTGRERVGVASRGPAVPARKFLVDPA
jgi:hypothetical protein